MAARADEEDLVRLLVDSVVDYAIFVLDADGTVRTWHPGAEQLKGYHRDEIVGRHFSVFYTPEDRESGLPQELLRKAERDGRVQDRGWRVRADGTRFWGDITITALRDESGGLVGFAKVTRDVTERHEMEEARRRALQREREATTELARVDELRTRLLAGISHDLTSPLVAADSSLHLVLSEPDLDPAEREQLLEAVVRNLERLGPLADQLREVARLQTGTLHLDIERVAVSEVTEACVADLRPLLEELTVEVTAADDVLVDRLAFERVLINLLTNAAQHSETGDHIRVSSERRGDEVVVSVADEGPGISPDDMDRIFEEFERGSPEVSDNETGLGLGLSIVRMYVEQHGGRVWVESEPGAGAVFLVALPAVMVATSSVAGERTGSETLASEPRQPRF
jgi:PAS domain S-box-containing protein